MADNGGAGGSARDLWPLKGPRVTIGAPDAAVVTADTRERGGRPRREVAEAAPNLKERVAPDRCGGCRAKTHRQSGGVATGGGGRRGATTAGRERASISSEEPQPPASNVRSARREVGSSRSAPVEEEPQPRRGVAPRGLEPVKK